MSKDLYDSYLETIAEYLEGEVVDEKDLYESVNFLAWCFKGYENMISSVNILTSLDIGEFDKINDMMEPLTK